MIWIILVLIGTIFYSVTILLQREFLKGKESNSFAYSIFFLLSISFLIAIYALITGFRVPAISPLTPNLVLMVALYALASLALYKGLKITDASQTSILSSSKSIWTMLAAIIFIGEPIRLWRIVGMILIILGIVVISLQKGEKRFHKGHILILVSAILFGLAFTNDAFLLKNFEAIPYSVIAFGLPGLMLLLTRPKSIKEMKFFFDKKRILKVLAVSVLYAIASVMIYLSYRLGGDASQIMPITQFSSILVVILGYVFLKERDIMFRKTIGSILALAGVFLLVS